MPPYLRPDSNTIITRTTTGGTWLMVCCDDDYVDYSTIPLKGDVEIFVAFEI